MLLELINFTATADKIFIDAFLNSGKPLRDAEALFSHILNAQDIWVKRINQIEVSRDRFYVHPVSDFEAMHFENISSLLNIYHTKDLSAQVIYKNSAGESFVNVAQDIIFHVVNHSTYHRAQVASMFKANGLTPPVTDFIFLKRDGSI